MIYRITVFQQRRWRETRGFFHEKKIVCKILKHLVFVEKAIKYIKKVLLLHVPRTSCSRENLKIAIKKTSHATSKFIEKLKFCLLRNFFVLNKW